MEYYPDMKKISVIGVGNMGEAIIRGLLKKSRTNNYEITAVDQDQSKLEQIEKTFEIKTSKEIIQNEINIIAVKPNNIKNLFENVTIKPESLYISVAAGVKVERFKNLLGEKARIVRVMPNLPAIVGAGVNVMFSENEKDLLIAQEIFNSTGSSYICKDENEINAATALCGSGPAFVALFIESLSIAAKENGLKLDTTKLAIETLIGTCKLLLEKEIEPKKLIQMVSSPNGTTVAGLNSFKKDNFQATVKNAIDAATKRAFELE